MKTTIGASLEKLVATSSMSDYDSRVVLTARSIITEMEAGLNRIAMMPYDTQAADVIDTARAALRRVEALQ